MVNISRRVQSVVSSLALAGALGIAPGIALADSTNFSPSRDTSMYSEGNTLSNGIGEYLFVGRTLIEDTRRAMIAFDVASIPAGSVVTNVSLSLHVSQARFGSGSVTVSAHRVLGAWGEGHSDAGTPGGGGTLADAGDATWSDRVYPVTRWNSPGGDFQATASGTVVMADVGYVTLASAPGLVADVQAWVDTPSSNQGWIFVSPEVGGNARRLDSRENAVLSTRPKLTITYTPPANSCPADLDNGSGTGTPDGGVDVNDLLYFLIEFEAGTLNADLDNGSGTGTPDGGVDVNDLLYFLIRFENGC